MSGRRRFETLLDGWRNGSLDEAETRELEAMLRGSAELRREYVRRMNLHAGLHEACELEVVADEAGEAGTRRSGLMVSPWVVAAAAAAVAGLLGLAALVDRGEGRPEEGAAVAVTAEPVERGIAVLARSVGAEWEPAGAGPEVGTAFEPRVLALKRGLVQVDFFSGATVVIEGPARIDLLSASHGVLHYGKVRTRVPEQARGFTLTTERAEFIDLGTEFALQRTVDGREELHVFDGEVEVVERDPAGQGSKTVVGGDGLAAVGDALWEVIEPDQERFVGLRELSRLEREVGEGRFTQWRAHRDAVAKRGDVVVYYDFQREGDDGNTLADRGVSGLDGAVVGCRWSDGRWPGKGALEFKQVGDRVRFEVPGEFDSLTLMAWVRIDGFDRRFNSIMLTDLYEDGHLHWQVKSDGRIDLGVKPPDALRLIYLSPKVITGRDLGRWMQLMMVYDGDGGSVVHYLDGEEVARFDLRVADFDGTPVREDFPLRIGKVELGNWNPARAYDEWLARNLNGRIDEFAVFRSALSAEEVRAMYGAGRP